MTDVSKKLDQVLATINHLPDKINGIENTLNKFNKRFSDVETKLKKNTEKIETKLLLIK